MTIAKAMEASKARMVIRPGTLRFYLMPTLASAYGRTIVGVTTQR